MLLSTTFHEQSPNRDDASLEQITMEGVVERLAPRFGDKAAGIVAAYAKDFPNARPIEIWSYILSARDRVIAAANAKLKQNAPVYLAWYGWQPPLFDNRMRAFHCNDIGFWFLNTDRMVTHTGGGARPRKLAYKMADALLAFMRTGDPNTSALPQWPKYTEAIGETMILDDQCEVKNSPDKNGLAALV
jgi:para-nitrobenzyl esterase